MCGLLPVEAASEKAAEKGNTEEAERKAAEAEQLAALAIEAGAPAQAGGREPVKV